MMLFSSISIIVVYDVLVSTAEGFPLALAFQMRKLIVHTIILVPVIDIAVKG